MRLNIVMLLSIVVSASMSLRPGDLTRLQALGSLPGKELEKEVKRMFFEGQRKMLGNKEFLELRELFSLRKMLNRAEQESLPGDVIVIAMLVTDGDVQTKYADSFEWDLEAEYGEELVKILIGEVGTNRIYASMQRATASSVVKLAYNNAGSIVAYHCMDNQCWNIPGRWRQAFAIMLDVILQTTGWRILDGGKYDKELLEVVKKAEFADLFCEHVLQYNDYDRVAARNRGFMELRITNEILAIKLHRDVLDCAEREDHEAFLSLVKKMGESPERILSDLIAEGYWLCSKGSKLDGFIRQLPEGHDVFRKMCERYPLEMKDVDRYGLSVEGLKTMIIEGKLDELVKNLIKRLVRCASTTGMWSLQCAGPRAKGLLWKLFKSGELNEDIKRGFKRVIKSCEYRKYVSAYFWGDSRVRTVLKKLYRSGEFDEEVKEMLGVAFKYGDASLLEYMLKNLPNAKGLLKALLCTVPRAKKVARGLLSTRKFNEMTRGCQKRHAETHSTYNLRSAKRMRVE